MESASTARVLQYVAPLVAFVSVAAAVWFVGDSLPIPAGLRVPAALLAGAVLGAADFALFRFVLVPRME